MSSINPLFKSYSLPDGNIITMLGGGSKTQKPLFTSYQNRGPKIIIAKRHGSTNYNDHGKMTVGFSSDFDDTFGTELSHMYTTVLNDTTIALTSQASDSFSINTGEISLEFRVLNVQRVPTRDYDMSNVATVSSLLGMSTLIDDVTRIASISPPIDLSIINEPNNPNAVQNKSPQFREFGSTYIINFQIQDYVLSQYILREANGDIRRNTFNIPLSSNIYGPMTYDVVMFVKDRNNSSSNVFNTTSIMRRYVNIEGLDNLQLTIVSGHDFAISGDTLSITWNFANVDESISNFTNIKMLKNNIAQTEIEGLTFSSIIKNGSNYSVNVSNLSAIESIGYRGDITAYVQWKQVHWSPLNRSSPIVYSYSSQPLSNFIIQVSNSKSVYRSLLDTQLYFKLQNNINYNNYFATNRPHNVTFYFHENDSTRSSDTIAGSATYTGLTNTNISIFEPFIISNLNRNTEYFVSYTISDGRNPTYTGLINNPDPILDGYKTRLDDIIPPSISDFSLIPMETSFRVRATVTDNMALESIQIIAISGDNTNKTDIQLQGLFNTANYIVSIGDVNGETSKTFDTSIGYQYAPPDAPLLMDTAYTVVMRVSDRGNNTVFVKVVGTTNPNIQIQNIIFDPGYQLYNVSANLEFSDIPNVNINYYMGVFTANIDSTNEAAVIALLTDPARAEHFLLGTNVDASPMMRVQGTITSAFNIDTRVRSSIVDFNYFNLVIFAKGYLQDYSFIKSLEQTYLQYRIDNSPPNISNFNVNFNVNMF